MLSAVINVFRVKDLRNKILFTVALLIIYRIGFHIPNPCFDQSAVEKTASQRDDQSPLGRAAEYMQIFTGGTLNRSSLFGLGIMPYITASIILMLLGEIVPALKKLRQEGQAGHKKIQEYMRISGNAVYENVGYLYISGDGGPRSVFRNIGHDRRHYFLDVVG